MSYPEELNMMIGTAYCEAPDTAPHPLLAPVISRDPTSKGRLAWRVTCAGVDPFHLSLFGATRKALTARLNVRAWVLEASLWAERAGVLCLATAPPPACHEWHLYAIVAVGAGLFHHCTMQVAPELLGVAALAHLRTGFSEQRVTEANRGGQYDRDWQVWVAASAQAKSDLESGALTDAEVAHLSPDPDHAGYLRLAGAAAVHVLGRLEQLSGDKLRAFYLEPGNWSRERTCWAR